NRITAFDEKLGCVTVEPGVTQRQLFDFLHRHNVPFWMDATGASLDASIIGNTVERGFGHTPCGDHWSNVSSVEAVLPNGECIHTGFGRFANAKASGAYRAGVGPGY